jgi:hypothetical protein
MTQLDATSLVNILAINNLKKLKFRKDFY